MFLNHLANNAKVETQLKFIKQFSLHLNEESFFLKLHQSKIFKIKLMSLTKFLLFIIPVFFSFQDKEQSHKNLFRFKADFTIKEKLADGKAQLTMGKVYYDKRNEKIVYQIKFPEKAIWVIDDKNLNLIIDEHLVKKEKNTILLGNSIFYLFLTDNLSDYGLNDSPYKISKSEKKDSVDVITWVTKKSNKNELKGKIILSIQQNKLIELLTYSVKNELESKSIFNNYSIINGNYFPSEIIKITYQDNKNLEDYQVTNYSNIFIDAIGEDDIYNFTLPKK